MVLSLVVVELHKPEPESEEPVVEQPARPYVLKLDGFSEVLETSDETAVDSLEPELADISSDRSARELVAQEPAREADEHLRRPEFRVDPAAQAEFEAELLMTPEEADSLLSSRYALFSNSPVSWPSARLFRDNLFLRTTPRLNALRALALLLFVLKPLAFIRQCFIFVFISFSRYLSRLSAQHAATGTCTGTNALSLFCCSMHEESGRDVSSESRRQKRCLTRD